MNTNYEEIFKNTTSVFQTENAISTSSRYKHITTIDIINKLENLNWFSQRAIEVKSKKNKGFQKHMVILRNPDITLEDRIPEDHKQGVNFVILMRYGATSDVISEVEE